MQAQELQPQRLGFMAGELRVPDDFDTLGRGDIEAPFGDATQPDPATQAAADRLPALHKDPFDRLLLAQALDEGLTLLTADAQLLRYGAPVRGV